MTEALTSHAIVHLSIQAVDAQTLPVLVELENPDKPVISISVARFARYLQLQGNASYESISKTVVAIGKLRDYYKLVSHEITIVEGSFRSFLEDFLAAFDHGTVLGWRPASNQQYLSTRAAVCDYVKFVMDSSPSRLDAVDTQFVSACRNSWVSLAHAEKSLLFHTKSRSRKKSHGRKRQAVGLKQYKPFPPNFVQELIDTTRNPRDKLIFAMLAYGGRRLSELLHLFLQDVTSKGRELHVQLMHPSQSPMKWTNEAHSQVQGTRREYLRAKFDLLPRTEHGAKRTAVGWKGIKFDDEAARSSDVYWIRDGGQYLLHLHRLYLHGARAATPKCNHPYYFVGENGEPLTVKALEKQFKLACRRLERKGGITLSGYGLHSLRHFYGFYCADVLKADLLLIQKWMGHMQVSSTAVYAHISPATAAKVLKRAEVLAQIEGRTGLNQVERERVASEFADIALQPLPDALKLGSTAFGQLDTKRLTRKAS
ncbi:MAG: tyrosine-type recombinase/integrase [Burkholderiales bacterium]|jgi:integrase